MRQPHGLSIVASPDVSSEALPLILIDLVGTCQVFVLEGTPNKQMVP
jgi:hypothetical protein